MGQRLRRLVGRTRRERVVTGLTAALLVVAVLGFLALDPAEDEKSSAARETLDTACVAAKAQIVEAANAVSGQGGPEEYALRVVLAMMDLRDAASVSGLDDTQALRAEALAAAAAAGRVGRIAREQPASESLTQALQESAAGLAELSSPTEALGLDRCTNASIDQVS